MSNASRGRRRNRKNQNKAPQKRRPNLRVVRPGATVAKTVQKVSRNRARKQATRQDNRTERNANRNIRRATSQGARQVGRSNRMQSQAMGGKFTPESTSARWGGIASTTGSVSDAVVAGFSGGATGIIEGLGETAAGMDWGSVGGAIGDAWEGASSGGSGDDYEEESITEASWFWPAVGTVAAVAAAVLLSGRKKS